MRASTPRWLWKLDAEHRFLIALGVAIVVFFTLPKTLGWSTRSLITWDVGISSLLLLIWSVIVTAHPQQIRRRAQTDDTNRLVVAIVVVGGASVSLFAVLFLLRVSKQLPPAEAALEFVLSVLAIVGSWLVVHTTFCVRYAHHFYNSDLPTSNGKTQASKPDTADPDIAGGLEFPNQSQPDYLDFAYFAFTIGMAAQTSDVQVTTRLMRQMVLVHALLSFAFNTIVVALSINILSQLLQ